MRKIMLILALGMTMYSCTPDPIHQMESEIELMPYLINFINDAEKKGIDLSYVYDNDITLEFADLKEAGGISHSLFNDKTVKIYINYDSFNNARETHKIKLMYHEFGHDILRYRHNNGTKIMSKPSIWPNTQEELDEMINEMFDHYINNKQ